MTPTTRSGRLLVCFAISSAIAVALPSVRAAAAEDLPIKGTSGKDTIQVYDVLKDGHGEVKVVKVRINGDSVNYNWDDDYKERKIKAGAGDDTIEIDIDYKFVIYGENGDDEIHGSGGADIIYGGYGDDVIRGFGGHDWMDGEYGRDSLYGGEGNDVIYGSKLDDHLEGGPGNDLMDGGKGDDQLKGNNDDDMLYGDDADDRLNGGPGNDLVSGGDGEDWLMGDAGDDLLLGDQDETQDHSTMSPAMWDAEREALMDDIEDDFGCSVKDKDRAWTVDELGYLREALELLPDEVINCWDGWGFGAKLKFRRKERCELPGYDEFSISGLQSNAIYLYDRIYRRDTDDIHFSFVRTVVHETGHSYQTSGELGSDNFDEFKEISGWTSGGKYDDDAQFVTSYARTNAREDWAESYSYYFCDPERLKDPDDGAPEKYEFINGLFGIYPTTAVATTTPGPAPGGKIDRPRRPRPVGPRPPRPGPPRR